MKAWWVDTPGPIAGSGGGARPGPLAYGDRPDPEPGPGQVLLRVGACGVCRTDLHLVEGDLPVHRAATVPGHEVVGRVERLGTGARRFAVGDRVGVAWLRWTCTTCRFCRRGDENLCLSPAFTGWDEDGGYAELAVVDEAYAYRLPDGFDDEHAAPLLCAGIVGYRALRRAAVPPGGRLGIYGFGASAHITAQIALAQGARVHVLTRSAAAQRLALDLGADWLVLQTPVPRRRSTRRSRSRPPAGWCRSRSPRSTGAGRWPWPASTSPRCRSSTTSATCSRSGSCAA